MDLPLSLQMLCDLYEPTHPVLVQRVKAAWAQGVAEDRRQEALAKSAENIARLQKLVDDLHLSERGRSGLAAMALFAVEAPGVLDGAKS